MTNGIYRASAFSATRTKDTRTREDMEQRDNNREFDLTGRRFGKLTVEAFDHYEKGASYWRCTCDCGGVKIASRKYLTNGHCKSCGCLRNGNAYAHRPQTYKRTTLTAAQLDWFIKHFKHTRNADICSRLDISGSYLHRLARQHGLTKSTQFRHKAQQAAAEAAAASHRRNGTYPEKGFRIPRSEEFGYKPGHKERKSVHDKRLAKSSETMRKTIKEEKARILWGLPQKTKLKLIAQPRYVAHMRYVLRKRGYIIGRGSMQAYYTASTDRDYWVEARRYGDKYYVGFDFKPLSEGEGAVVIS